MGAFLYGVFLQWKLDIRSKTLLITCYIVPLLFCDYGRDLYIRHAGSEIHADSVYDGFRRNNGGADRPASVPR